MIDQPALIDCPAGSRRIFLILVWQASFPNPYNSPGFFPYILVQIIETKGWAEYPVQGERYQWIKK
jgi:hypothetical protein